MAKRYTGSAVPAIDNRALVSGDARYVADIASDGTLCMAILRSPHAHARIRSIDTARAASHPGVVRVVTGEDMREAPVYRAPPGSAAVEPRDATTYALRFDRVRYVGEPVVAVLASDRLAAREALALVAVDYEVLPAVLDRDRALDGESPLVEPDWGSNVLDSERVTAGDLERAFAEDEVDHGTLVSARITASPIEPRGVLASWDESARQLTCWSATQGPHALRNYLSLALGLPETSVRVVQPRVGGAFGCKAPISHEEFLACHLSIALRRPVRWIEERDEHLVAAGHARDTRCEYSVSYRTDGLITGLRARVVADVGTLTSVGGWPMATVTWLCLPGPYRIPNLDIELQVVVTNTCPWAGYRGFGKDAAMFFLDRTVDRVAHLTKLDSAQVRLRNFIPPDAFPYAQPNGSVIDSGDYPATLQTVLRAVDHEGFRARQDAARREGRFIGLSLGQELTPEGHATANTLLTGSETTLVRVTPTGLVAVLTGVTSPGTGNETAIAQIVADTLGCSFDAVVVTQGDTAICPVGGGNFSSRSVILGGSAAMLAAQDIRDTLAPVAASMLGTSVEDVDASDGRWSRISAPDQRIALGDVVREVFVNTHGRHTAGVEPNLESSRTFRIDNINHTPQPGERANTYPTWSNASAACVVEVDPETGGVRVLDYALAHDSGRIINPLLADAQLHGAIVQGIGASLYEAVRYDDAGVPLTETLGDYTLPSTREWVAVDIHHLETPSPYTPLGAKGVGESGISAVAGAIAGAIEDALPHLELRLAHLPLTPSTLWHAIQAAEGRHAPADV